MHKKEVKTAYILKYDLITLIKGIIDILMA